MVELWASRLLATSLVLCRPPVLKLQTAVSGRICCAFSNATPNNLSARSFSFLCLKPIQHINHAAILCHLFRSSHSTVTYLLCCRPSCLNCEQKRSFCVYPKRHKIFKRHAERRALCFICLGYLCCLVQKYCALDHVLHLVPKITHTKTHKNAHEFRAEHTCSSIIFGRVVIFKRPHKITCIYL